MRSYPGTPMMGMRYRSAYWRQSPFPLTFRYSYSGGRARNSDIGQAKPGRKQDQLIMATDFKVIGKRDSRCGKPSACRAIIGPTDQHHANVQFRGPHLIKNQFRECRFFFSCRCFCALRPCTRRVLVVIVPSSHLRVKFKTIVEGYTF